MSHTMYLIEKEELLDLLTAWYKMDYCDIYGIDNWPGWESAGEYKKEWCRENLQEYDEQLTFRHMAEYELKNYEETELAWET